MPPQVTVVGSLNIDRIATVERLPRPGETVSAGRLVRRFGGKGANQALAAKRSGVHVAMIGCVGDDPDGHAYLAHLQANAIDTGAISVSSRHATGAALIAVDGPGENQIVVALGANLILTTHAVRRSRVAIATASVLLLQLEVPLTSVLAAVGIADKARIPVVFNPSPWRADFPWGMHHIQFVIVNESEAEALLGFCPPGATAAVWRDLRDRLRHMGIGALIVTRGARSTLCFSDSLTAAVPTLRVKSVDTVGAGDAFAGSFAAALAVGKPIRDAVRRANCAGALSTLRPGAQEGLCTGEEVARAARKAGLRLDG